MHIFKNRRKILIRHTIKKGNAQSKKKVQSQIGKQRKQEKKSIKMTNKGKKHKKKRKHREEENK